MLALEGSATPVARLFARVYRGEVLRIKQHPAAVQLASCARRCLASRLGCAEAELIDSSNPDFENAAAAACDDFACSPEAAALWAEVVQSVSGVAAEAMYWDKYKLRVQPTEQHAVSTCMCSLQNLPPGFSRREASKSAYPSDVGCRPNGIKEFF